MTVINYAVVSLILSILTYKFILKILKVSGSTQKNYRGKQIPKSTGILILFNTIIIFGIQIIFNFSSINRNLSKLYPFFILIIGSTIIGLIDDILGNREHLGFKGHIKALKDGVITSGLLKALSGLILSVIVATYLITDLYLLILNTLVIVLSMNFFNLLDLRPGRSLKIFIMAIIIALLFSYKVFYWPFMAFLIGPILVLLYLDLSEQSLIGDTGSNTIGAIFGFIIVVSFSISVKIIFLVLLVIFHIYTEFYSFSEMVRNNKILSWFDLLGRKYKD